MKNFDGWNELKKQLHNKANIDFYFKEREIWFCSLGVNIGFEQDGKKEGFERPVLIIKKFDKYVFWGVPLSTKMKPGNTHYLALQHGTLQFSAIISQLRLYSASRLTRKLYRLANARYRLVLERVISELYSGSSVIKKSDSAKPESSEPEGHCGEIVSDTVQVVNTSLISLTKKKRTLAKTKHRKGSFRNDTTVIIARSTDKVKNLGKQGKT